MNRPPTPSPPTLTAAPTHLRRCRFPGSQRLIQPGSRYGQDKPIAARIAFLYVNPWAHEFEAYHQGTVPSHRLFFAHEVAELGRKVAIYRSRKFGPGRAGLLSWRLGQAVWAALGATDACVATHEAAAYPSLLLKRLGLMRKPIVVLAVAPNAAMAQLGWRGRLIRWLLDASDVVFTYSRQQAAEVAALLTRARVQFIHFAVDASFLRNQPSAERQSFVLAVGTNEGKDYPTLIEALPPEQTLVIVTDQQNIDRAKENIRDKDVTFLSDIPIKELCGLYNRCSRLVLPLRDAQMSTGQTVLLENLALGTPVIVTNVPCIHDYIDDTGVTLVPEGDVEALRDTLLSVPVAQTNLATPTTAETAQMITTQLDTLIGKRAEQ